MERVVEEHYHHDDTRGDGSNSMWGVIVLLIVLVLFFVYGLPAIRSISSSPTVNIPGRVDVNIHQPTTK